VYAVVAEPMYPVAIEAVHPVVTEVTIVTTMNTTEAYEKMNITEHVR
jgi:hypothetical protein